MRSTVQISMFGGTVTVQDDITYLTGGSGMFLTTGTLDFNDHNYTSDSISLSGSGVRTLLMRSGTFTFTGTNSTAWFADTSTNFTLNAGTSTIIIQSANNLRTIAGGGLIYNNLTITGTGTNAVAISKANTFNNISITSSPNKLSLPNGFTTTVSSLSISGGPGTVMNTLQSDSAGSTATLSDSSGLSFLDYVKIQDITATGGAIFEASINCVNVSNNSGWIFEENRLFNQYRAIHVGNGMSRSEGAT